MQKTRLYLLITFAISWPLAFCYFAFAASQMSVLFFGALYMFIPALAACLVQRAVYKQPIRQPLGVSFRPNRWFLVGLLLPPLIAVATTGVSALMPGVRLTSNPRASDLFQSFSETFSDEALADASRSLDNLPLHPYLMTLIGGTLAGLTINAVFGFGEELGWRGLMQRDLAPWGFWKSSWLIGIVWGIWHLPFILQGHNYPGHPYVGVVAMTIWTTLFAPLIGFVCLRAESVVAAAIMHGSVNGTAIVPALVLSGGDPLLVGTMGLAGMIVLVVLNLALYWWQRRTI